MSTVTKSEMDENLSKITSFKFTESASKRIEMKKSRNAHDISLFKGCRLAKLIDMVKSKYITGRAYNNFLGYIRRKSNPNHEWLLTRFLGVYVLVADMNQEKGCNEKWKDFMNEEKYKILKSNQQYVIGYMLVDDTCYEDEHHYIDFINTRLRGHNIADLMIRKYVDDVMDNSNVYTNYLYPLEIVYSAMGYWRKQLKFIFEFIIDCFADDIYYADDTDTAVVDTNNRIKQYFNIKMDINWTKLIYMLINENLGNDIDESDCDKKFMAYYTKKYYKKNKKSIKPNK